MKTHTIIVSANVVDEQMRDIPGFLDRRKWSKKQKREYRERLAKAERAEQQYQLFKRHQKAVEREARRAMERAFLVRKEEIREEKKQLEVRKRTRIARRNEVYAAVSQGHDTVAKIRKSTNLERKFVQNALRWLVKKGSVVKPSPRRYKTLFY